MMNTKISILGIGWLGFPLAKKLIETGYEVKGSTTSESKLALLKANGIQPFKILLSEDCIEGNIEAFLADSEILLIDIPPKLRGNSTENFVKKIKILILKIENSNVKKVLFVSSTSVYADVFPVAEMDENTLPNPDSESGKQLLQVENNLLSNANFQTIILRFGGLIGEDRHPIKFLAGKSNLENPDAPVNLIHQEDAVGIIVEMLKRPEVSGQQNKGLRQAQSDNIENNKILKHPKIMGQYDKWIKDSVFNAVAPQHPTRKEYYTQKALKNKLTLPLFDDSKKSIGKRISSEKLQEIINYTFKREL